MGYKKSPDLYQKDDSWVGAAIAIFLSELLMWIENSNTKNAAAA